MCDLNVNQISAFNEGKSSYYMRNVQEQELFVFQSGDCAFE